jgi:mRNA interferase MazF
MDQNLKGIIKRGDLLLVKLGDEKIGSIQSGLRPVLVISNNRQNRHSSILLTIPLSTKKVDRKILPTHIEITNDSLINGYILKNSTLLCEQLTTIDRKMVIKKIGALQPEIIESKIKEAIEITLGFALAPESA